MRRGRGRDGVRSSTRGDDWKPSVGDFRPRKYPRDAPPRTVARDAETRERRRDERSPRGRQRGGPTLGGVRDVVVFREARAREARVRTVRRFRAKRPKSSPSGGVCTKSPFVARSVRVDDAPVAADVAARDANRRVLDAEATAAEARARAVAAETALVETRAALAASVASAAESAAETQTLRAQVRDTRRDANEAAAVAERFGDDASRAERAAESARALARRKIAEARAEADRRVAEAARDERPARNDARGRRDSANAAARRAGARGVIRRRREPRPAPRSSARRPRRVPGTPRIRRAAKANDAARTRSGPAAPPAAAREIKARDDARRRDRRRRNCAVKISFPARREVSREEKSRGDTSPPNGVEGDSAEGDSGYSEGDLRRSFSFPPAAHASHGSGVFAVSRVVQSRRDAGERGRGETTRGGSRSRRARGSNLRPIGKRRTIQREPTRTSAAARAAARDEPVLHADARAYHRARNRAVFFRPIHRRPENVARRITHPPSRKTSSGGV